MPVPWIFQKHIILLFRVSFELPLLGDFNLRLHIARVPADLVGLIEDPFYEIADALREEDDSRIAEIGKRYISIIAEWKNGARKL